MNGDYWLDRAVEKIRFTPDRKAVRRELAAHLEDRREALEAQGLERYEAERAATEAMGDPAAVAEELARIHTPYWGWLWRASRWVLAVIVLWAAVVLLPSAYSDWKYLRAFSWEREARTIQALAEAGSAMTYDCGAERTVLEVWHPEGSVAAGSYRFSVPYVWLERWEIPPGPEGGENWTYSQIVVYTRTSTWRFWELPLYSVLTDGRMTDSKGGQYFGGGFRFEYPVEPFDYEDVSFAADISIYGSWKKTFAAWHRWGLYQESPENVPEWIDMPLGDSGKSIHIDLVREVVSG